MRTVQNLHMHSVFDDGKDTCAAMLKACERAGLHSAGVSLHSPLPFTNDWAAREEQIALFLKEMEAQKQAFAGRMQVQTGIEWDVLSAGIDLSQFQYVIGSVHHLPGGEIPVSVDFTPEVLEKAILQDFGGDADAVSECYFSELQKVAACPEVQICGHFDLLLKFNERNALINPESERYLRAGTRALDALLEAGKVFEVNTGAISRGWRTEPYPMPNWLCRIAAAGGRVTVSSDAHSVDHVTEAFDEAEQLLLACGFREIQVLEESGEWRPVSLCED